MARAPASAFPLKESVERVYQYSPNGNIQQITDGTRNEITAYQYDDLDRLTRATATQNNSVLYERTWSYDQIGNITTLGVWPSTPGNYTSGSVGGASLNTTNNNRGRITAFTNGSYAPFTKGSLGPVSSDSNAGRASFASGALNTTTAYRGSVTAFTGGVAVLPFTKGPGGTYLPNPPQGWAYTAYTYGNSAHKHAVTALSTGETYQYDANGNMTQRIEGGSTYTQNFDAENRLTSVVVGGQTTTFVYDGDGNLIKRVRPDNTSTLYLGGGLYELELNASNAVTKKTSYYPNGAMRVDVVGGSNTLYYLLKDHLGSASTLTDSSGNLVANGEQRYYPFGESRIASADLKTAHLFTGQLEMGLGGIYHYGARFYSVKLGRFLSADTIVPDEKNPQSHNRYAYVINNPLRHTDPTGHTYADCDNPASGNNTAYTNPNGGVFSQADCWAYNAAFNQAQGIVNATTSGSNADKQEAIEYIRAWLQLPEDAKDKACPLKDVVGVDTCYNFQTVLDPDYFFDYNPVTGQFQLGSFAKKGNDDDKSSKCEVHHICTNKNWKVAPKWSALFKELFDKGGLDLDDNINKVELPGHKGRHPFAYHQWVNKQLTAATKGLTDMNEIRGALEVELKAIAEELLADPSLLKGPK
jgi:RHS repeat-associated protein